MKASRALRAVAALALIAGLPVCGAKAGLRPLNAPRHAGAPLRNHDGHAFGPARWRGHYPHRDESNDGDIWSANGPDDSQTQAEPPQVAVFLPPFPPPEPFVATASGPQIVEIGARKAHRHWPVVVYGDSSR